MTPAEAETLRDDVLVLVEAAWREAGRLVGAVERLARQVEELTIELRDGELPDTNRLLGVLLGQLGCPYERR
jgi:hypothetical protein